MSERTSPSGCIRPMQLTDVDQVVRIHMRAFPGFFLTFLGAPFLRQLYRGILQDHSGFGFVYEKDGVVAGFVAGTEQASGFYRRLLRTRWLQFGLASLMPLLRQPSALLRLLRAFKKPAESVPPATGTLMSIATAPDCQGSGIGKHLVQAFLAQAQQRGLRYVNLTTDKVNNEAVNHFYQALGFSLSHSYQTPEGRWMNEYIIDLPEATAP